MLRNMLDSITGMEQSFQLQTFSSLRAANQWLLLQDRITVTAFEVQGVATVGIGKFLPRRVLIAYQTEEEPNDFYYGISSGLEYIYDGDDLTHSIETNWKHRIRSWNWSRFRRSWFTAFGRITGNTMLCTGHPMPRTAAGTPFCVSAMSSPTRITSTTVRFAITARYLPPNS